MTIYRQDKFQRPSRQRHWPKLILLVLAVFFLVFAGSAVLGRAGGFAVAIARPFWQAAAMFAGGEGTVLGENRELKAKVNQLEARLLEQNRLRSDNESLRAALGRLITERPTVTARIISNPWRNPYDTIILDMGSVNSKQSISSGDLVIFEDSILLGEVTAVYKQTTKVRLFSASGNEIPVVIGSGEGAIPAIATGQGAGNFLILLPRGIDVSSGMIVTTMFAGGPLTLGVISEIDRAPNESLQKIYSRNPINIAAINWVQIYAQ